METCSGDNRSHEEIVIEGRECPLCAALFEIEQKDRELDRLDDAIERLKQENSGAR